MIKCPRCNLPQEESPKCEYCGLVFKASAESSRTPKAAHSRRTALFIIIAVFAAVLLFYYFFSSENKSNEKSTVVGSSGFNSQRAEENELWKTAKELSGDVGVITKITDGSTKGSIIAMLIFSIIGIGYLSYGKRSQQLLMAGCGIALIVYSYFVTGTLYIIMIGSALSALPFIFGRK
jgi:hypothetical protein